VLFGGIHDITHERNDLHVFDLQTSKWTISKYSKNIAENLISLGINCKLLLFFSILNWIFILIFVCFPKLTRTLLIAVKPINPMRTHILIYTIRSLMRVELTIFIRLIALTKRIFQGRETDLKMT